MNPYYILIYGPAVLLLAALAYLVGWAAIAPHMAWQNVQNRR